MYQTALLLLTGPLRLVVETIGQYLNCANKRVSKRLYVKLEPELIRPFSKSDSVNLTRLSSIVPVIYSKASSVCKNLDIRVILTSVKQSKFEYNKPLIFDAIFTNSASGEQNIHTYVESNFDNRECHLIKFDNINSTDYVKETDRSMSEYKTFKTVCLGGTFDHLHNGHKVMLTEAILRTSEKLIIGVSDIALLQKKVLSELIEPIEKRMEDLITFLAEVDPSLQYELVPLYDLYGPTTINPDIECVVVTTETKIGGMKVNSERARKGMHEVFLCIVDLVENSDHTHDEEQKLSSTTERMRMLGTPLKITKPTRKVDKPYCILLRGHLGCEKSFISQKFQSFGVPVLSCDEILCAILHKDSNIKENFAQLFPNEISNEDDTLDLKKLQVLCLKNKDIKNWFEETVYPKVKCSLQQVLKVYYEQGGYKIIVADSTVCEGYDLEIDAQEIWAAILPPAEALKNLKTEYNLTEEEAANIAKVLPSNEKYVQEANIVFCHNWSVEGIEEQINKAWLYLKSMEVSQL